MGSPDKVFWMRNVIRNLFGLMMMAGLGLVGGVGGCTHVSGMVEQAPGVPLRTAVLSAGRPDGIAVYATYHVNSQGRFDFDLFPTDESALYVYDGAADPRLTLRRIDERDIRPNMKIMMRPANPNSEMGPGMP
jgi:hypothetical protein